MGRAKVGSALMYYMTGDAETGDEALVQNPSGTFMSEEFDASKPFALQIEGSVLSEVWTVISEGANNTATELCAMLGKKTHAGLRGSFQQVPSKDDSLSKALAKITFLDSKVATRMGNEFVPFVDVIRRHTMRVGISSFPLTGLGAILIPINQIGVSIVDVSLCIDEGDLQLLEQFDKAFEDKKMSKNIWPHSVLNPGDALWLPYGVVPLVCTSEEMGSFVVMPVPCEKMLKKVSDDAVELLFNACVKYGKKHIEKTPWKTLVPALTAFLETRA
jgi:hypothetical protein